MRPFFNSPIDDDAGTPRSLVSLQRLRWDERRADPAFAAAAHRASQAVRMSPNTGAIITFVMLVMFVGLGTGLALAGSFSPWLSLLVSLPICLVGVGFIRHIGQRKHAKHAVDILLTDSICPACAYNLAGLPEADGIVACSECGAAWRSSRLLRRHTFALRSTASRIGPLGRLWEWARTFEAQGPTSIDDDLRWTRPIATPRLIWPLRTAEGERRERLLAARVEMLRHGHGQRLALSIGFPLFMGLMLGFKFLTGFRGGDWFVAVILLWNIVQIPLLTLRGSQGIKDHHIRAAMLRRRLCPSCAGDLPTECDAQAADLCRCPECGAGWRVPDQPGSQSPARSGGVSG